MTDINLQPVAIVTNNRNTLSDDFWGGTISEINLLPHIPEAAFDHIEDFSHLEIIYYFDQVDRNNVVFSGHPRGNPQWPGVGIFAQRKKDRPNQIGLCTVELIGHKGRTITVKLLDAINNSPVLDIKPVFKEFKPGTEIKQPDWVSGLMIDYWK